MRISIFGLGYVGCVGAACLAMNGHKIIGVDINLDKVDLINKGRPTIVEKDIDGMINTQWKAQNLSATLDYLVAVTGTDLSFICVGTPSSENGQLNLDYIWETARQIGQGLKNKNSFHIIAIRSTVYPGTNQKVCEIIEQASGKIRNRDFAVVSNPEFLREGTAVNDYYNPPVTVIGSDHAGAIQKMTEIYKDLNGPVQVTDIRVAELIKYVNNAFHALKIVFANEVGNICKQLGIDSHDVMQLFCMDKQLNISPYYLKPGFAYGGSCLPKDLKALKTIAHDNYLDTPVLNNIENSNNLQKELGLKLIEKWSKMKILILGVSFKSGTDDLRYSPVIDVIQTLIGKGYNLKLYDRNVTLSRLTGQNKSYIMEKLPHIGNLLIDNLENEIEWADIIVFNNKEQEFADLKIPEGKKIIDFCRMEQYIHHPGYEGISW